MRHNIELVLTWCYPDNTVYTFPNVAPYVFMVCKLCHSILRTVGLVRGSEVVSVNKLAVTFILLCLVLMVNYCSCSMYY